MGPFAQFFHGSGGSQTQQIVAAGDERQIHDVSRSKREKPVNRVAVRQWQFWAASTIS